MRRARLLVGSKLALVVGLVLFVGLAWLIEQVIGLRGPVRMSPVVAIVVAGVPASLWLAFFYLQDRYEPEPMHFVFGVFLLGTLVAAPLADFVIYQLARPSARGNRTPVDRGPRRLASTSWPVTAETPRPSSPSRWTASST